MTKEELKLKLDANEEKFNKRLTLIKKKCAKLGFNDNLFINDMKNMFNKKYLDNDNIKVEFIRKDDLSDLISKYGTDLPIHNADGSFNEENYDYNYELGELEDSVRKYWDLYKVYLNWLNKYNKAVSSEEKYNSNRIAVLDKFLDDWAKRVKEFYLKDKDDYIESLNKVHNEVYNYLKENDYMTADRNTRTIIENQFLKQYKWAARYIDVRKFAQLESKTASITLNLLNVKFVPEEEYSFLPSFATKGHYELRSYDEDKLDKLIAQEKEVKYRELVDRVESEVGTITDVSNLSIGAQHGELNGIVEGTNGKCYVETIGAGGWNIVCFHYRVLVHKVK